MHLTVRSDHAMRLLMFCALHPERLVTVAHIAETCGMSETHLAKIAHALAAAGFIETTRGRRGGVRLARPPEAITVGAVLRAMETGVGLTECLGPEPNTCVLAPACRLRRAFVAALEAFFAELDRHSLADLTTDSDDLRSLLGLGSQGDATELLYSEYQ